MNTQVNIDTAMEIVTFVRLIKKINKNKPIGRYNESGGIVPYEKPITPSTDLRKFVISLSPQAIGAAVGSTRLTSIAGLYVSIDEAIRFPIYTRPAILEILELSGTPFTIAHFPHKATKYMFCISGVPQPFEGETFLLAGLRAINAILAKKHGILPDASKVIPKKPVNVSVKKKAGKLVRVGTKTSRTRTKK